MYHPRINSWVENISEIDSVSYCSMIDHNGYTESSSEDNHESSDDSIEFRKYTDNLQSFNLMQELHRGLQSELMKMGLSAGNIANLPYKNQDDLQTGISSSSNSACSDTNLSSEKESQKDYFFDHVGSGNQNTKSCDQCAKQEAWSLVIIRNLKLKIQRLEKEMNDLRNSARSTVINSSEPALIGSSDLGASENSDGVHSKKGCAHCEVNTHPIWFCSKFKSLSISERWARAKELKLCYQCLSSGHVGATCPRSMTCGINHCYLAHNRLLHDEDRRQKIYYSRYDSQSMTPPGEKNRHKKFDQRSRVKTTVSNGNRSSAPSSDEIVEEKSTEKRKRKHKKYVNWDTVSSRDEPESATLKNQKKSKSRKKKKPTCSIEVDSDELDENFESFPISPGGGSRMDDLDPIGLESHELGGGPELVGVKGGHSHGEGLTTHVMVHAPENLMDDEITDLKSVDNSSRLSDSSAPSDGTSRSTAASSGGTKMKILCRDTCFMQHLCGKACICNLPYY